MNPVMEADPLLVLAEKGDVEPAQRHNDFRFFATMTVGSSVGSVTNELSPALYNRFSVFHMDEISFEKEALAQLAEEIKLVARASLDSSTTDREIALVGDVCCVLAEKYHEHRLSSLLTFRNFVRLVDSTYLLRLEFPSLPFSSALWTAFQVTVVSQLKEESVKYEGSVGKGKDKEKPKSFKADLVDTVSLILGQLPKDVPDFLSKYQGQSSEHVLTPARKEHAQAVLACITCSIPVLLEVRRERVTELIINRVLLQLVRRP
jgi:hypothetical protein